jgi:putative ABC transport system permease protein
MSKLGDRVYAGLLRLLPFDFRAEFGGEMEDVFREQRAETERRRGFGGLLRMWGATIADIFRMAPREHASVLAQDTRYALRMMRRTWGTPPPCSSWASTGVNTSIFAQCTPSCSPLHSGATTWWCCVSRPRRSGELFFRSRNE